MRRALHLVGLGLWGCAGTPGDAGDTGETGRAATAGTGATGATGHTGVVPTADTGVTATLDTAPTGAPDTGRASSPAVGDVVWVPAGSFVQGCVPGRDDVAGAVCEGSNEVPSRTVTITRAFWVTRAELGQGAFTALAGTNPSAFATAGCGDPACPVENVTWWEALAAANAASDAEGRDRCYVLDGCSGALGEGMVCTGVTVTAPGGDPQACTGWRVPTEAEWAYAARGGEDHAYAGSDDVDAVAWAWADSTCQEGTGACLPHPGCDKAPNGFGLCDMSGNVWAWVWDGFAEGYPPGDAVDPVVAPTASETRVRRGGDCRTPRCARVAYRTKSPPDFQDPFVGLRLVRTAQP